MVERLAYTYAEVAEMVGVSYTTIWRMVDRGEINVVSFRGAHRIPQEELDRLLTPKPRRSRVVSKPVQTHHPKPYRKGDLERYLEGEFAKLRKRKKEEARKRATG